MLCLQRVSSLCKNSRLAMTALRHYETDRTSGTIGDLLQSVYTNKVNMGLINRVGPDLACANWLVDNGAWVRFKGSTEFYTKSYDLPGAEKTLLGSMWMERGVILDPTKVKPESSKTRSLRPKRTSRNKANNPIVSNDTSVPIKVPTLTDYVLEEIYAEESTITMRGFHYFMECKGVKKLRLLHCSFVNDEVLSSMNRLQLRDSLEHIEILCCSGVTETGLNLLTKFSNLKYIRLFDLPDVVHADLLKRCLEVELPGCKVETSHI